MHFSILKIEKFKNFRIEFIYYVQATSHCLSIFRYVIEPQTVPVLLLMNVLRVRMTLKSRENCRSQKKKDLLVKCCKCSDLRFMTLHVWPRNGAKTARKRILFKNKMLISKLMKFTYLYFLFLFFLFPSKRLGVVEQFYGENLAFLAKFSKVIQKSSLFLYDFRKLLLASNHLSQKIGRITTFPYRQIDFRVLGPSTKKWLLTNKKKS